MFNIKNMKFGALKSPNDPHDFHIAAAIPIQEQFEENYMIPYSIHQVYNQQLSPMCVAFSIGLICELHNNKEYNKDIPLSKAFIYSNRDWEDAEGFYEGEGVYPRGALKQLQKCGTCRAELWDELTNNWYASYQKITDEMRNDALKYKINSYARLYTTNEIKSALKTIGAVTISIPVTDKFVGDYNEIIDWNYANKHHYGNHMVTVIGWETYKNIEYWVIVNSWGTDWGNYGGMFFYPTENPINEAWSIVDWIEPKKQPQKYYRCQVGAFISKDSAKKYQEQVAIQGLSTYIVNIDGYFKIQLGAWLSYELATKFKDSLLEKGIQAFVTYY